MHTGLAIGTTSGVLPNGIAAGDVTTSSAVLWARVLGGGSVRFDVATDVDFANIVASRDVASLDGAPMHAPVSGLEDSMRYYYRAVPASGEAAMGTFVTAAEAGYHRLNFGVSGDWRGGLTPYAALANADDAHLDFFVQLGDTIYSDHPSPAVPHGRAETLDEYRAKYVETSTERGGANFLVDLRASTAVHSMIDDHEVINDFAGGAPATSDPRFDPTGATFINETQRYRDGLQAFNEHRPLTPRVWSATGDPSVDGRPDLYRTQAYGQDAQVFLVDARSFRAPELDDADLTNPADVGRFLLQSADPSRTMLGRPQLERLKADLLAAESNGTLWKFVMVPEPIQNLGPAQAADRFEGYAAERNDLLKFIDDNDISNVVFVAADIHGTVVNNLTYQASFGGSQIPLDAFEITTGAVAYYQPLGPTVVNFAQEVGLIGPLQKAFYDLLPVSNDPDSFVNDKDDFLKSVINEQLGPFGYDPVGLNDNLLSAEGLVDSVLISGDYVAAHTFGWTQFNIDEETHELEVTTYGLSPYSEEEAAADPAGIAQRVPQVVSQFVVYPDQTLAGSTGLDSIVGGVGDDVLSGGAGDDLLVGLAGNDRAYGGSGEDELDGDDGDDTLSGSTGDDITYGGAGNDLLAGGAGNDRLLGELSADRLNGGTGNDSLDGGDGRDTLIGGGGKDTMTGGAGPDQFLFAPGDSRPGGSLRDLITDFTSGEDVLDLRALGIADYAAQVSAQTIGSGVILHVDIDRDGFDYADFAVQLAGVSSLAAGDLLI